MKVALGMSGGVDSSLCAHLLTEAGHQVTGVYLECWRAPGCRTEEDRADALKVALSLNLPFQVLDFKQTYKVKVVEYFFSSYQAGRTPNPDTICNQEIKFGLFYDWAMKNGFDAIATGHYAKKLTYRSHSYLAIPADAHKDQTYFLYLLKEEQLEHTLFPLSDLAKTQVRQFAETKKIHVADKKDSTGICFIGDINVHDFLKDRLGENPGDVVDTTGTVVGRHLGLWFYTIGQRGGFSLNQTSLVHRSEGDIISRHNIPPFYVIAKNPDTNQLVVGFGHEANTQKFMIRDVHWINGQIGQQIFTKANDNHQLLVRIRHTGQLLPCTAQVSGQNLVICLDESVRGIAQGQAAVLYVPTQENLICLGGGEIENFTL